MDDQNPERVSPETDGTQELALECAKGVTKEQPDQAAEMARPVLVTEAEKRGVTKTSSPETLSSTGISENEAEVLVTRAQVKRARPPRFTEGDWDAVRWG
jgi:predicted type IV restriction endonuclease